MGDPGSLEEYNRLFTLRQRIDGYGLDVAMHLPCPFCAAPDFTSWRVFAAHGDMNRDATCSECGRSARFPVTTDPFGGVTGELVQTGGPDPPDWLQPPPRRVSPTDPAKE